MEATASILDPVQQTLSPFIWDHPEAPEPVLKPKVAAYIQRTIYVVLERHGYSRPHEWLRLCLTGSLTTYQYADDSDCDVSLFVDSKVFPEWSRAEMIGIMISEVDGGQAVIPGTPYPLQCFVVARKFRPADLYRPGLRSGYDIDGARWVVPPDKGHAHDVQAQEYGAYAEGLEAADKMERLLRYEPDKATQYWHQIHSRRMRDQTAGKGDYSDSNIIYKFLAKRGLLPEIASLTGEHIASTSGQFRGVRLWTPVRTPEAAVTDFIGDDTLQVPQGLQDSPQAQPIRPHELSSPTAIERGHSRPVTPEEWHSIADQGRSRYEAMSSNLTGTGGLDAAWPQLKEHAWQQVQQPWGGATINAQTGQPIESGADLYALTAKEPGMDTVSVPLNASREHFMSAMDEARRRFGHLLQRSNHHLGVFRDEDVQRLDFDPVLVTPDRHEAEAIGAHTRNVGGAYHFASGDGFWPPHVPEHLGAEWGLAAPQPVSYAQFRGANRTDLAPLWPSGTV